MRVPVHTPKGRGRDDQRQRGQTKREIVVVVWIESTIGRKRDHLAALAQKILIISKTVCC